MSRFSLKWTSTSAGMENVTLLALTTTMESLVPEHGIQREKCGPMTGRVSFTIKKRNIMKLVTKNLLID